MVAAESGQFAWQMEQKHQQHCIMLDLKVPAMSGEELFQTTRTFDEDLARRIDFITDDTISADTLSFVTSCEIFVLSKPVDLVKVREYVESSSQR